MGEKRGNWKWEVTGFEPRKSFEFYNDIPLPLFRRGSVPLLSSSSSSDISRRPINPRIQILNDRIEIVKEELLELRQEVSDLQEYSNAKLERVARYLGVLVKRTQLLDQVVINAEASIGSLMNEKRNLFNDLFTLHGSFKVFCRIRPLFEDEGSSIVELPNDSTVHVNTGNCVVPNMKKDFHFDRVYGPHIGQVDVFGDVQPFVRSAFDGYNVSIFAYGQANSGKTHSFEGSTLDRGLYVRCFEELFDLSNSDSAPSSKYIFSVTVLELQNDEMLDLLSDSKKFTSETPVESSYVFAELTRLKVQNPLAFSKVLKTAFTNRQSTLVKCNLSHLIISVHIDYYNLVTGEAIFSSKLSLVDLAGSDIIRMDDDARVTPLNILPVSKSLLGLRDTLSSLNAKKDTISYDDSMLTKILSDSIGGSSKTLLIVHICPSAASKLDTLSTLVFSAEVQNSSPKESTGDSSMKHDYAKELFAKEQEIQNLKQHILTIDQQYNDKLNAERDQNICLKNQISQLLQAEQDRRKVLQQYDPTVDSLEAFGPSEELSQTKNSRGGDSNGQENLRDGNNFSFDPEMEGAVVVVKSDAEKVKTTPAGEYLCSALNDFCCEQYDGLAAVSDGANKLLMLVLAAVIKAGSSREHEILAEIREAVFSFIRRMEPRMVMDNMLVSRVRILYIRSLLARSPELHSVEVSNVEIFLEKVGSSVERSRDTSEGNSPQGAAALFDNDIGASDFNEKFQPFKVNIRPEKKSKLFSVVLKIRGVDQEAWRQQVTEEKLKEITEDAKSYASGNRRLAALFVHNPAGELQRQIKAWLSANFNFLSASEQNGCGSTGQLELLSTAIMDGWMAGLGRAQPPCTDAIGRLLYTYSKEVYQQKLQHLKDVGSTRATDDVGDLAHVAKLSSALESIDRKRRKIIQQWRRDSGLLGPTPEDSGSPPPPKQCTAVEETRLASLVSLGALLKQVKEIMGESSTTSGVSGTKKTALDDLRRHLPSLLDIDRPCALRHIDYACRRVLEGGDGMVCSGAGAAEVRQWSVLQFNMGPAPPFVVKCGASSGKDLVVKAAARVDDPTVGMVKAVLPLPEALEGMSMEEVKEVMSSLPEAVGLLSLARTVDGTLARYSRLYRTILAKVPAFRDAGGARPD